MGLMVWGRITHITVGRAGFGITAGPMIFYAHDLREVADCLKKPVMIT